MGYLLKSFRERARSRAGSGGGLASLGLLLPGSPSPIQQGQPQQQQQQQQHGHASISAAFSADGGAGSGKGVKETAAIMEHLRIPPGPIEHFIEALFDPAGSVIVSDGAGVRYLPPPAPSQPFPSAESLTAIVGLQICSLEDFASSTAPAFHNFASSGGSSSSSSPGTSAVAPSSSPPPSQGAASVQGAGGGAAASSASAAPADPLEAAAEGTESSGLPQQHQPALQSTQQPPQPQSPPPAHAALPAAAAPAPPSPPAAPAAPAAPGAAVASPGAGGGGGTPSPPLPFDVNPLAISLLAPVARALATLPDGVPRFVMCLEARRSEGSPRLTLASAQLAAAALEVALMRVGNKCDFPRGRSLMAISQTFYALCKPGQEAQQGGSIWEKASEVCALASAPGGAEEAALRAAAADLAVVVGAAGAGGGGGTIATATAAAAAPLPPRQPPPTFASPLSSSSPSSPAAASPPAAASAALLSSPPKASRVYLQSRVRSNPLWQNMQFWESAVYEAVGAEVAKYNAAREEARMTTHGRSAFTAATADARAREVDVVFGQLGFYAYTMISFGLPEEVLVLTLPCGPRNTHPPRTLLLRLSPHTLCDSRTGPSRHPPPLTNTLLPCLLCRVRKFLEKYAKFMNLDQEKWKQLSSNIHLFSQTEAANAK